MRVLKWLTSFLAWLEIAASPFFFGVIVGLVIYGVYPNTPGLVFGIAVAAIGMIAGIVYATRIWKKRGTVDFISRVSASPELDNLEGVED